MEVVNNFFHNLEKVETVVEMENIEDENVVVVVDSVHVDKELGFGDVVHPNDFVNHKVVKTKVEITGKNSIGDFTTAIEITKRNVERDRDNVFVVFLTKVIVAKIFCFVANAKGDGNDELDVSEIKNL